MNVCACERACVRACTCVCVRVRARARVYVCARVCVCVVGLKAGFASYRHCTGDRTTSSEDLCDWQRGAKTARTARLPHVTGGEVHFLSTPASGHHSISTGSHQLRFRVEPETHQCGLFFHFVLAAPKCHDRKCLGKRFPLKTRIVPEVHRVGTYISLSDDVGTATMLHVEATVYCKLQCGL